MDGNAKAATAFWRQELGATHYGFASTDPGARAEYVQHIAAAAARTWWTQIWTNSPTLLFDPRVDLHHADTAALMGMVHRLAEARREETWGADQGPSSGSPVLVLILDLPDGLGGQRSSIYKLLRAGTNKGISATLVLPSLCTDFIDEASRQLLAEDAPWSTRSLRPQLPGPG